MKPEDWRAMRDNVYSNKNISKSIKCNLEDISCHCGGFLSKKTLLKTLLPRLPCLKSPIFECIPVSAPAMWHTRVTCCRPRDSLCITVPRAAFLFCTYPINPLHQHLLMWDYRGMRKPMGCRGLLILPIALGSVRMCKINQWSPHRLS